MTFEQLYAKFGHGVQLLCWLPQQKGWGALADIKIKMGEVDSCSIDMIPSVPWLQSPAIVAFTIWVITFAQP